LTPDNDVYVDEPVKFIARKEDITVIIKNHEINSITFLSSNFKITRKRKTIAPAINPFNEKCRPGIYGRNNGVMTIPEKYARNTFRSVGPPTPEKLLNEKPLLLIPDIKKRTAIVPRR
jgi:hypothetical protein